MNAPTPKQIRELRLEHGLTQHELARSLYVTRVTVNNWETGRSRMSAGHWELMQLKLAKRHARIAELERTIDNLRAQIEVLTGD